MSDSSEKKIIIDEDWKSQVQAEKEQVEKPKTTQPSVSGEMHAPPPASFAMLISTLATEALVGLGQIPPPGADAVELNLDQAQYFIDMLGLLEEKTRGNLSTEEQEMLGGLLHQLRMAFLSLRDAAK